MTSAGRVASPLARRVIAATSTVAIVTAISLAGAAALVSHWVWLSRESTRLAKSAHALVRSIKLEQHEGDRSLEQAVFDAVHENAVPDCKIEVYKGGRLIAAQPEGAPPIGLEAARDPASSPWIVASSAFDAETTVLVGAPRRQSGRAWETFLISLVLASPVCALLAWIVGRRAASRVSRPIERFRDRVLALRPGRALERLDDPEASAELVDLDAAFRESLEGYSAALVREREFAANASHELRTPLARIRLRIERAAHHSASAERSELEQAMQEVDRLVRMVDSLLVLAHDVEQKLIGEAINVADITRQVAARVFPRLDAIELEAPDEALVRGDEELIAIAIENLLDNARKFSRSDLAIPVSVRAIEDQVVFGVSSRGATIAEAEREKVFHRFYRSPEERTRSEGYGLGLPLCRHIARLHGGDARVLTDARGDVRFELTFPAWR